MSAQNAVPKAQRFLDYPEAKETIHEGYLKALENNPVMSGLPLAILANILSRVGFLQSFFWHNAGFASIAKIPELKNLPVRFHPAVISTGVVDPPLVPFAQRLLEPSSHHPSGKYHSVADYHAAYLSGDVTPLQVIDTLLPLIAQNQQPRGVYENGWIHPHDSVHLALEAAKASTERYAQGKPLSILDGVPIGVKDDTDVEGWVNHWGMNPNMPNNPNYKPCEKSCWPVLKLQEAGAIVIGKNRMHELGSETSGCNPSQGTPTNHHNNSYYPGGSTNGGASAVSAGIVPFVVGTDGGGSVRIPSANNGIYGIQPSHQRTMTLDCTMVRTGPLAGTVADLTIAYRLMAQPDPDDSFRKLYAPSQPLDPKARRTIGIYPDWWAPADPRVAAVCRAAVDYLAAEKGYDIVDISIPFIQEGRLAHGLLCLGEISRAARAHAPEGSGFWLRHVNNSNKLLLSVASQSTTEDFLAANAMRELQMRHLAYLFQKHPNLLIVTPTTPVIGWPRVPNDDAYGSSDTNISIKNMMYVWLSNLTGTPAATAPVGFVEPDQGEGKMPIGLMALGEWGAEEQLLGWAAELEEYLHEKVEGGRRKPAAWFDVLAETKRTAGK